VIPDIYADPRIPHEAYRQTFVKSLAAVPIRRGEPIGAVGAYWALAHTASVSQVATLQALADAAATAIENVRLLDDLDRARVQAARQAAENHALYERAAAELRQRKAVENALRDSQERLRLALDAGGLRTWEVDLTSGAITWTEGRGAMIDAATGQGAARTQERVPEEDRQRLLEAMRAARDQGAEFQCEFRLVDGAGQVQRVRGRGRFTTGSGTSDRMIGVLQEIGDQDGPP
jgi:PAS domain-containing protein